MTKGYSILFQSVAAIAIGVTLSGCKYAEQDEVQQTNKAIFDAAYNQSLGDQSLSVSHTFCTWNKYDGKVCDDHSERLVAVDAENNFTYEVVSDNRVIRREIPNTYNSEVEFDLSTGVASFGRYGEKGVKSADESTHLSNALSDAQKAACFLSKEEASRKINKKYCSGPN